MASKAIQTSLSDTPLSAPVITEYFSIKQEQEQLSLPCLRKERSLNCSNVMCDFKEILEKRIRADTQQGSFDQDLWLAILTKKILSDT